jgi:3',5'-cyclic AMP phosphodiesterase CpdA
VIPVKIALVSDTHLSARAPRLNANWDCALDWIARRDFDAVIHLGDITADAVHDPRELAFARKAFSPIEDRIRFLPGNHDVGDNPAAPGAATEYPLSLERLGQYHDVFGAGCWWFAAGHWRCIGLNAQLFGTGTDAEGEQEQWLESVVARASEPLALFLHKPLFRDGWEEHEVHSRYVPRAVRQRLKAILPAGGLRLVVSGHAHQARRVACEGAAHVWMPSTSFCIPDVLQEKLGEKIVGVAALELSGERASLHYSTPPGMIRHNLMELGSLYPQVDRFDPKLRNATL